MKKLLLTGMASMLVAVSCTTANQKMTVNADALKFKGDWQITNVTYEKGYKVKSFDEADAQCFVGSQWRLIPNNNSGAYTINEGGNCAAVTQPIKFEVTENNEFKFKKLLPNVKAKNVTSGYVLQVEKQDADHFTLVQDIPFEGKTLKVYYKFARTGEIK